MTTIQVRRGTAAQWTAANPVLGDGEFGHESDTGKHKVGDGTSAWSVLEYFTPGDDFVWDADDIPDGSSKVVMTNAERAKLGDLDIEGTVAGMFVQGANITLSYDSVAKELTISSTGGGAVGTDPEGVRDTVYAALRGAGGIVFSQDDTADTISATLSSVTIAQVDTLQSTIDDLYDQLQGKSDVGVSGLPAGSILVARKPSGGSWPLRPTTRSDIIVLWIGADPAPTIIATPGTGGMLDNVDVRMVTP